MTGDHYLQSTYNAIMLVAEFGVKDLYTITNVRFKNIRVDGTGTSVVSARVEGSATFQNVDARNVGAVGVNNCGSFHFTPAGSEVAATPTWAATTVAGWHRGCSRTRSRVTTVLRLSLRRLLQLGRRFLPRALGRVGDRRGPDARRRSTASGIVLPSTARSPIPAAPGCC